jgi:hypothetical protein
VANPPEFRGVLAGCQHPTHGQYSAAANSNAEFGQKEFSFGRVFVCYERLFVSRLDKAIRNQMIKRLPFVVSQLLGPLRAPPPY